MPTLDELRAWLQGDAVEALPEHEKPGSLSIGQDQRDCPDCEGEGGANGKTCAMCKGHGSIDRDEPRPAFGDRMKAKAQAKKRGGKYNITDDGTDAHLLFGRNKGAKLSDLSKTRDGRSYLGWLIKEDFPQELKTLAEKWCEHGILADGRNRAMVRARRRKAAKK